MKLKCVHSTNRLEKESLDGLVVFLPEKSGTRESGLAQLADAYKKQINAAVKQEVFSGKLGSTLRLFSSGSKIPQLLLTGLGKREKLDNEVLRRAAGAAGKALAGSKMKTLGVVVTTLLHKVSGEDAGQCLTEGLTLGAYQFQEYKSAENSRNKTKQLKVRINDPGKLSSSRAVRSGFIRAEATNLARTLGNTPANDLTPKDLAEHAQKLCRQHGFKCQVLEEKDMRRLGMGMLLGVTQGSRKPAKLIIMEHRAQGAKQTVAVVGKGITFDSGGISLKPGKSMDEMKFDMCGAAAVMGAMDAVGQIKPGTNIIGVIPAAENLPSGEAQRPGDIVTAHNGKRVEILNTDAEGRLILGDALSYTIKEYKPDAVIDLATLTGACVVALGHHATGAITNHDTLMDRVRKAGETSGDRVWQLPNFPEYGELLKGKYGDLQNIGGPDAGTITGGMFLENFVGDTPWVHLDIAGTAWNVKHVDYQPANGATGVGVRLIIDLLQDWQPLK